MSRPLSVRQAAVLCALYAAPDRAFRVGEMCRAIGDGATGAVSNALAALQKRGVATLVSSSPGKWRLGDGHRARELLVDHPDGHCKAVEMPAGNE